MDEVSVGFSALQGAFIDAEVVLSGRSIAELSCLGWQQ